MAAISSLDLLVLEQLCDIIAETDGGLSSTEIGKMLARMGIADPPGGLNKRTRVFEALRLKQEQDRCGNLVFAFIELVMNPVRYTQNDALFEGRRERVNVVLAFSGYELGSDGKFRTRSVATTIDQAQQKAQRLRTELVRRGVHADVLKFCTAELIREDYFHAVLEATKSISQKIRDLTGLTGDSGELAVKALSLGQVGMPFLAFNSLQNDSQKSEQTGLMNLMTGMFGTFRNPTAHAPRIHWHISENDAIDLLTMTSFLHRRLDTAARTPRQV